MVDFHDATWEERTRLVETFEDERFREIGRCLIYLEEPSVLNPQSRDQLEKWLEFRRNGREGVKSGRTVNAVSHSNAAFSLSSIGIASSAGNLCARSRLAPKPRH